MNFFVIRNQSKTRYHNIFRVNIQKQLMLSKTDSGTCKNWNSWRAGLPRDIPGRREIPGPEEISGPATWHRAAQQLRLPGPLNTWTPDPPPHIIRAGPWKIECKSTRHQRPGKAAGCWVGRRNSYQSGGGSGAVGQWGRKEVVRRGDVVSGLVWSGLVWSGLKNPAALEIL